MNDQQRLTQVCALDKQEPWRAIIDEINCNPEQAVRIYDSPAVCDNFVSDAHRRFSEVLYQNADGYWFLVRPLAPDEAREWLAHPHHDHLLARQLFPRREKSGT